MSIRRFLLKLANVDYFFWAALWLMFLVVIGTLAQKDQGLYQAQNTYFSTWIFWAGFIPLPSGLPTMGIIFVGLLSQLTFKTPFTSRKIGIAITHLGAFLLLLGGLFTALFSIEGSMMIPEGGSAGYFHDAHKLELAIINTTSSSDHDLTTAFGEGHLEAGKTLAHESVPFKLKILKFCPNSSLKQDPSIADNLLISCIPLAKEDTENLAGLEFEIFGSASDGKYYAVEGMPPMQDFQDQKGSIYQIEVRHKRYHLPFEIQLQDFDKKMHAGTEQAKSYRSVISLIDGKINQRAVIQMNEPLRYRGYTLYQSSFIENNGQQITVLSVVKNVGRLFPYISSIIICIGLLIHLLQNLPFFFKSRSG